VPSTAPLDARKRSDPHAEDGARQQAAPLAPIPTWAVLCQAQMPALTLRRIFYGEMLALCKLCLNDPAGSGGLGTAQKAAASLRSPRG